MLKITHKRDIEVTRDRDEVYTYAISLDKQMAQRLEQKTHPSLRWYKSFCVG